MGNITRQDASVTGLQVFTGRVVAGKIELGDTLPEGTVVAILAPDPERPALTTDDQHALSDALDEIRRGEFEDGIALLQEIKDQAGR